MNSDRSRGDSEILLYQTEDGTTRVEFRIQEETVWLNQTAMVELFQTTKQNGSLHLKNIYQEGELSRQATVKECLTVRKEGKRHVERHVEHYNLEAFIAVGCPVKSHRGTQYRKWATERLREYLVKGFALDDECLKEGRNLAADYFDELLPQAVVGGRGRARRG